ncbi:ParB-like nuclease domain containing protein [Pelagibacter phage HTVC112P]|nr:ParB-like nuclease domain containing protein [Pelagibacter phage HTVC112P]
MEIIEMDINEIKPYKDNPREIPIESVKKVADSIKEFGNNQPIVVDNKNIIVVGHTRWKALKQLGRNKAFIVKKDFTENEAMAYRIMDNRSGEESKWEKELLKNELNILRDKDFNLDLTGLSFDEIEKFTDTIPIFEPTNDIMADINTDEITAPISTVKMVQLFFNNETEKKFRAMVKELETEYNKDNITDTVFAIVEREFKNYKDETTR